ncbi:hypothetical protein Lrub_2348 [Legionella rubrilucens]|uniref:Uncharacterized protein n=1 Tax=Legionella rubrilucens TaxID=458 RepID=A0A0W0XLT0_9GAMM|nr:hypothetical protein [Legionella rubrilucens]KTD45551.1 hypothetical protein Lrub_2348 [Legionella rubrilucens]
MTLILEQFLQGGKNERVLVTEDAPKGRKPQNFDEYLQVLNFISAIREEGSQESATALVKKLAVKILTEYKKELERTSAQWNHPRNPQLFVIAKKLEAIAYLVGDKLVDDIFFEDKEKATQGFSFALLRRIHREKKSYEGDNFLAREQEGLKFAHFDRHKLAVQLMLRVLSPRYINQSNDQVCGVNSFVHNIALMNPLVYVKMVDQLAVHGEFDFSTLFKQHGDFKVQITETAIFEKAEETGQDGIHDADHIILNGIRSSQNILHTYRSEGPEFIKQIFGVSMPNELKRWMKASGYTNVHTLSLSTEDSFAQLQLLMADGCSVAFLGTGTLAQIILGLTSVEEVGKPGALAQKLDGHFFVINQIQYDKTTQEVQLKIMTWGEEQTVTLPLDVWQQYQGQATAFVGKNPYMTSLFRNKIRQSVSEGDQPYFAAEAYCLFIHQMLSNREATSLSKAHRQQIIAKLHEAYRHDKGKTWLEAAVELRDYIHALPPEEQKGMPLHAAILDMALFTEVSSLNEALNAKAYCLFVKNRLDNFPDTLRTQISARLNQVNAESASDWGEAALAIRDLIREDEARAFCKEAERTLEPFKDSIGAILASSKTWVEAEFNIRGLFFHDNKKYQSQLPAKVNYLEIPANDALLAEASLSANEEKIRWLEYLRAQQDHVEIRRQLLTLYIAEKKWSRALVMFDHVDNPMDKALLCHALRKAMPVEQSLKSTQPAPEKTASSIAWPLVGFSAAGLIGGALTGLGIAGGLGSALATAALAGPVGWALVGVAALLAIGSFVLGLVTLKGNTSDNAPSPQSDPSLDKLEELAINGAPCQLVSQLNVKPEAIGQSLQEDDELGAGQDADLEVGQNAEESLDLAQPLAVDFSEEEKNSEITYKQQSFQQ